MYGLRSTCYVHDCLAARLRRGAKIPSGITGEMNRDLLHSRYGEQSALPSSFLSRAMFSNQHRWMCTPGRGLRRTRPRVVRFQGAFACLPLLNSSPSRWQASLINNQLTGLPRPSTLGAGPSSWVDAVRQRGKRRLYLDRGSIGLWTKLSREILSRSRPRCPSATLRL